MTQIFDQFSALDPARERKQIEEAVGGSLDGSLTATGTDNDLTISGSATGNPVTIAASGSDTDISIELVPKGAGGFFIPKKAAFGDALIGVDPTADYAGDSDYEVGIAADYTFIGSSGAGMALRVILDPSVAPFLGAGIGLETEIASGNVHDFTSINGLTSQLVHYGSGSTNAGGLYTTAFTGAIANEGGGTIPNAWVFNAQINNDSGNVTEARGFTADPFGGVGTYGTIYSFWSAAQTHATNNYYSWFDSRGVRRVKEDATYDSVGQAIEALYNPQFTKYTPGAANYERVVLGQWNGNVAEIGVEKGGTGTLRSLKLIGASLTLPGLCNLPVQAAPGSPADGDIWRQDNTNTGLKIRINGVTKTITVS